MCHFGCERSSIKDFGNWSWVSGGWTYHVGYSVSSASLTAFFSERAFDEQTLWQHRKTQKKKKKKERNSFFSLVEFSLDIIFFCFFSFFFLPLIGVCILDFFYYNWFLQLEFQKETFFWSVVGISILCFLQFGLYSTFMFTKKWFFWCWEFEKIRQSTKKLKRLEFLFLNNECSVG